MATQGDEIAAAPASDATEAQRTARRSCNMCTKRKRRCSGMPAPCQLCLKNNLQCVFSQPRRRGPKPRKHLGSGQLAGDRGLLAVGNAQQQRQMQAMLPAHPSLHTGQLLGQEERKYLEIYLMAYMGIGFVREQEVQRTAMRLLTHGKSGLSRAMTPDQGASRWHAVIAAANESLLLSCIAGGKVLCSASRVNEAQPYIDCARALVSYCGESPVLSLMLAYLNLTFIHVVIEDYAGFFAYSQSAADVGAAILRAQADAASTGRELDPATKIDEEAWILFEAMRVVKAYAVAYLEGEPAWKAAVQHRLVYHFGRRGLVLQDVMSNMPGHHLVPGSMFIFYSPPVEGFPDPLSKVREEDRAAIMAPMMAMQSQLPSHTVVVTSMMQLAQPEVKREQEGELVATASRGHTRLVPVVFGLDMRVAQVMMMINATPRGMDFTAAREAGARLQRILERLVTAIANESFLARPGLVHMAVAWGIIFLRLLAGDEEGCLQALRRTAHMLTSAPGLLRFTRLRHNTHWVAALLLNAGLRAEHDALTHAVNAMGLAQGRDMLPVHEEGKARLCLCSEFRCAAVHCIVADMNAHGAARIFTHCTQLDLHPSEVAAIDLATQPSAMYITWCGRAPNTKLWERVTPEEGIAQEAPPRNASYPADAYDAAAATRVSSAASSNEDDHGNSGGDVTNQIGNQGSYTLAPAGTMAATDVDDALEHRAGVLRLPMPRPVRPPLPADAAQDTFYGTDDYLSEDGIPESAADAGASGLAFDASHWRGVPDSAVGAHFAAGLGSSGRAASFDPDADDLYDAAEFQDAPVDEELLAQLAAELDDESLLDMADACFMDNALNPMVQQHHLQQQQQQQQHPQSVFTQAAIDTGGLLDADLSATLQHPYPLQAAEATGLPFLSPNAGSCASLRHQQAAQPLLASLRTAQDDTLANSTGAGVAAAALSQQQSPSVALRSSGKVAPELPEDEQLQGDAAGSSAHSERATVFAVRR
eukprot:TRINITY_DN2989_c0_g1_i2.p1 TRINITY_DN2989_c0_g1~~TRINITY_DN2989_c0_g1_i2.p1  ORF type:complete len:988 (-),score=268.86 TRINITY_DN2989_c0_g1_i2:499-3462(-)